MNIPKQPPNNQQIERAMLASIIIDNDILSLSNIKPNWLFYHTHQKLLQEMLSLHRQGKKIDVLILSSNTWIDADDIFSISIDVMSASGWKEYEDILLELYTKRNLLKVSQEIAQSIDTSNTNEMLIKMKKLLSSVEEKDIWVNWYDLVIETLEDLTTAPTNICDYGYSILDKVFWWYKEWQLIVIWGRPWFWKTALIVELMYRILKQGKKASMYSLEMSNTELIKRMITNWTNIPIRELHKEDNITDIANRSDKHADYMKNAIFYDKVIDFNAIERSIRRSVIVNWTNVVFIDHLWLIRSNTKYQNKNQEIWMITATLKTLAKETGTAIVLLSQLNRNVEKRNDEPELSDLRDSGSIEQDADIVMMLHREKDWDWHYDNSRFDILVRKNRNWNLSKIAMISDLTHMKIDEFIPKKQ